MFDTLLEILETLRRNKFRTAMTGFAVSWGIFILVVLLGASSGLQHGMEHNYAGRMSNSMSISGGWAQMPYQGLPIWREIQLNHQAYKLLEQHSEIELLSPVHEKTLAVRYQEEESTMNVRGVYESYAQIKKAEMLVGRHFLPVDIADAMKVAVLNERAVKEIANGNMNIVGQFIQLGGLFFRVIGVTVDKEAWGGSEVIIPFSTFQGIFQPDGRFRRVEAVLRPGVKNFESVVRHELSPILRFDERDERALWITDYEEQYADMMKLMWGLRAFILIVSICTLISGAVGVSNIMLVSVRERTKELGIRKALGAPPIEVLRSVVGESLMITSIFGMIGGLLGAGVVRVIDIMTANAETPIFLNPSVDTFTVVVATLILVAVGATAGAIPAAKAMKVKPIEAMNADK